MIQIIIQEAMAFCPEEDESVWKEPSGRKQMWFANIVLMMAQSAAYIVSFSGTPQAKALEATSDLSDPGGA